MESLVGQKIGHLTVIKYGMTSWNKRGLVCRCDCGNTVVRLRYDLTKKKKQPATCGQKCPYFEVPKRKAFKAEWGNDLANEWLTRAWR